MKNWIIAVLVGVIAIGGALGAFAATQTVETTETVEVRFWQGVNDNSVLWYKARPEGGDWTPITRLRMPDFDRSGNYHQGDIAIDVPIGVTVEVPDPPPAETAEPSPPSQPDIELTNLRCESRTVGRYYSNHDRTLRGTVKNVSDVVITEMVVYGSLYEDGKGIETDRDYNFDVLLSGVGWSFEVTFGEELGDCNLWKIVYEKMVIKPTGTVQNDLLISGETCGEQDWAGRESLYFTITNVSDVQITDIEVLASVYGDSADEVDSDSSYGIPRLGPGEEAVVRITFDDFENEAQRCVLDTLTYKKEVGLSEAIPFASEQ